MLSHQRYKISSIHNKAFQSVDNPLVVCYHIKDTKFHQFTTLFPSFISCGSLYAITSKIQNFINSQHIWRRIRRQIVVCYHIKDTKFHQFTTFIIQSTLGDWLYAITSKIQNFINSQQSKRSFSSREGCMLSHQRYKISSIHNTSFFIISDGCVVCYHIKDTKFHQFTTRHKKYVFYFGLYAITSKIQNFINSQLMEFIYLGMTSCMLSHQRYKISSIHNF